MGQPIVVVEKPSAANPGMLRFETNRALTGMGHERYTSLDQATGDRPPDVLARRLFARGGIDMVHVNGNIVTVDVTKGHDPEGIAEVIENLYIFYPETDTPADETVVAADVVAEPEA